MNVNPRLFVNGAPVAYKPAFVSALCGVAEVNAKDTVFSEHGLLWLVGRPIAPAKREIRGEVNVDGGLWLFSVTDLAYPFTHDKITPEGIEKQNMWKKMNTDALKKDECSGGFVVLIEGLNLPSVSYFNTYAIIVRRSNRTYEGSANGVPGTHEMPFVFVNWVSASVRSTEPILMGELMDFCNTHGNLSEFDCGEISNEFKNTDIPILMDLRHDTRNTIMNPIALTATGNDKFRDIVNLMVNYLHGYLINPNSTLAAHFVGEAVAERLTTHECNKVVTFVFTNPIAAMSYQRMVWMLLRVCRTKVARYTILQVFANTFRSFAQFSNVGRLALGLATDMNCPEDKLNDAKLLWEEEKLRERMFLCERYSGNGSMRFDGVFDNNYTMVWHSKDEPVCKNQNTFDAVQRHKILSVNIFGPDKNRMEAFPWWWGEAAESVVTRLLKKDKLELVDMPKSAHEIVPIVQFLEQSIEESGGFDIDVDTTTLFVTGTSVEAASLDCEILGEKKYFALPLDQALAYLSGKCDNQHTPLSEIKRLVVLRAEWCTAENLCALAGIPVHGETAEDAWTLGDDEALNEIQSIWLFGDSVCARSATRGFDSSGFFSSLCKIANQKSPQHYRKTHLDLSEHKAHAFCDGENADFEQITEVDMDVSLYEAKPLVLWTWVPSASSTSMAATRFRVEAKRLMKDHEDEEESDEKLRKRQTNVCVHQRYHIPSTGEMMNCEFIGTGCYRALKLCRCTNETQRNGVRPREATWMAEMDGEENRVDDHFICCETSNVPENKVFWTRQRRIDGAKLMFGETATRDLVNKPLRRRLTLVCHDFIPASIIPATKYCGPSVKSVVLVCVRGQGIPLSSRDVVAIAESFSELEFSTVLLNLDDGCYDYGNVWDQYFKKEYDIRGVRWLEGVLGKEELWFVAMEE